MLMLRMVKQCNVRAVQVGIKEAETSESMCAHMVKELTEGCLDQPDIKAGFIGEIGITYPMTSKLK